MGPRKRLGVRRGERQIELGVRMLSHTANVRVQSGEETVEKRMREEGRREKEKRYKGWGREHKRNTSRY